MDFHPQLLPILAAALAAVIVRGGRRGGRANRETTPTPPHPTPPSTYLQLPIAFVVLRQVYAAVNTPKAPDHESEAFFESEKGCEPPRAPRARARNPTAHAHAALARSGLESGVRCEVHRPSASHRRQHGAHSPPSPP